MLYRLFPEFRLSGEKKVCFGVNHSFGGNGAGDTAVFYSAPLATPPAFPLQVWSPDYPRNVVFTIRASKSR